MLLVQGAYEDCIDAILYWLPSTSSLSPRELIFDKVTPVSELLFRLWIGTFPDVFASELFTFVVDWLCDGRDYGSGRLSDRSGVGISTRAGANDEDFGRLRGGWLFGRQAVPEVVSVH